MDQIERIARAIATADRCGEWPLTITDEGRRWVNENWRNFEIKARAAQLVMDIDRAEEDLDEDDDA